MEREIKTLAQYLVAESVLLAVAESCTGGWVGKSLTDLPGSSRWFDRGFITYSNLAKIQMLGVNEVTLEKHGAVSEQVAIEMVNGVLANSQATYAVSVTGIAGPDGGTESKPVGMVCFAWAKRGGQVCAETSKFTGSRDEIRQKSVGCALRGLLTNCFNSPLI